ncbi:MAG: hypothetical protein ACI89J_002023 [Hyphomicrobiaceae bacterium]|jgi:hypothetical protein
MRYSVTAFLMCLPLLVGSMALAADTKHREAGAHAHGHGKVNIAIEGKQLFIELEAPGADIVGFEHEAKTTDEKAAVKQATADLKNPGNVIELPPSANCKARKADVELHQEPGGDGHGEFHVTYEFQCGNVSKLSQITFSYFERFKNAEELDTSVITSKGSKKFEATRKAPTIQLGGLL